MFFFSSRRRHTRLQGDWSSDVCSSDLEQLGRLIRLTRDLGVNLAGVEIILRMRRRMLDMQKQIEDLLTYVRAEGEGGADAERGSQPRPREAIVRAARGQLQSIDVF